LSGWVFETDLIVLSG
jgi:hypothetical protein